MFFVIGLKNRWGDFKEIGICGNLGLYLTDAYDYTLEYINKIEKLKSANQKKEREVFIFFMPYCLECFSEQFTSEETAWRIIQEWLDTGQYTQYYLNKSGEIKTKKYLFSPK